MRTRRDLRCGLRFLPCATSSLYIAGVKAGSMALDRTIQYPWPRRTCPNRQRGRRWSFLSWEDENRFMGSFLRTCTEGRCCYRKKDIPDVCTALGKEVSMDYVYRLFHRHAWRKIGPRPRHIKQSLLSRRNLKKLPIIVKEAIADLSGDMPIRILFHDEARFGRISDRRRCWAPRLNRP